jgi:hypothetical protein
MPRADIRGLAREELFFAMLIAVVAADVAQPLAEDAWNTHGPRRVAQA